GKGDPAALRKGRSVSDPDRLRQRAWAGIVRRCTRRDTILAAPPAGGGTARPSSAARAPEISAS
ncbi:MAG: hypothetical protein ACREFP_10015, partial [Acetobacteraceae bacterium]